MKKKIVLSSGGMDSLACMYEAVEEYGANIISVGFNYGQRHFIQENAAAERLCERFGIPRTVFDIPALAQIGGSSLTDHSTEVTTDMSKQRTTVVPQRNAIFLIVFTSLVVIIKPIATIAGKNIINERISALIL